MRASTVTKLSLYDFAKIVGINPLHFGQVTYVPPGQRARSCDQAYLQYDWQDADRVSRESIAMAIAEAEALVENNLGFRLAPSFETDEWRATERPVRPELVNTNAHDLRGYGVAVRAQWGNFISGGVRSKEVLGLARPIVWSDNDSDGYKETATVTCPVTVAQNPCEVKVYYPAESGADEWEIRPVNVSILGLVATITFRREQTVLAALQESTFPDSVDGTDDALFLGSVDVYRVYLDPQVQVSFLWEPVALGCANCDGEGCPTCAYAIQSGCLHVRGNPRNSLVVYSPADWDRALLDFTATSWAVARAPDIVRLYYQAGLRDKNLPCTDVMDAQWKRTIAHFACALLDRPPCECVTTQWEYWRSDLALTAGSDSTNSQMGYSQLSPEDLRCPFGTRRGMIDAWHRCLEQGMVQVAVP